MTVTVITLLKRRAGMSREDFRAYYESNHKLIGEEVLGPYATRYVCRYIAPFDGVDEEHDYDVVMEIDFPGEAEVEAFFADIADPETAERIATDEAKLFDRSRIRAFRLEREERSEL